MPKVNWSEGRIVTMGKVIRVTRISVKSKERLEKAGYIIIITGGYQ